MSRGRRATQRTKYHAGLTPETVIDAAVELTRIKGLETWSLRDLSKELGVAPSAVYHHVGGREVLSQQVVRRVLLMIDAPTTVMPWRDWFRSTLFSARPVLMRYPGVARWLILHGPALPEMAPIVDSAIESLNEAGFGERVGFVCSALINVAMMVIVRGTMRLSFRVSPMSLRAVPGSRSYRVMSSHGSRALRMRRMLRETSTTVPSSRLSWMGSRRVCLLVVSSNGSRMMSVA